MIGNVTIAGGASVRPFAVLRGDMDNYVTLDRNSNVQDSSVLHVTEALPCIVGDNVTIGHRAVVHACRVMNNLRIGIGAIVLDGAVIEEGAQVGAGALVPPGKVVPAGWLVMGVPAKPVRKMNADGAGGHHEKRARLSSRSGAATTGSARLRRSRLAAATCEQRKHPGRWGVQSNVPSMPPPKTVTWCSLGGSARSRLQFARHAR